MKKYSIPALLKELRRLRDERDFIEEVLEVTQKEMHLLKADMEKLQDDHRKTIKALLDENMIKMTNLVYRYKGEFNKKSKE